MFSLTGFRRQRFEVNLTGRLRNNDFAARSMVEPLSAMPIRRRDRARNLSLDDRQTLSSQFAGVKPILGPSL
jgi:hypothetical protein